MSEYRIAIVRADASDRRPVKLHPGGRGERDLVQAVTDAAVKRGVGFWRTEAHVKQALAEAFDEVLASLKSEVRP